MQRVAVTSAIIRCAARATRNELRVAPSRQVGIIIARAHKLVYVNSSSTIRGLFTPNSPDVTHFLPAID
jgi:hypothetical protein